MSKGMSSKVRKNLLEVVEFPPRFGESQEFSGLVIECIRNGYLNGTGMSMNLCDLGLEVW